MPHTKKEFKHRMLTADGYTRAKRSCPCGYEATPGRPENVTRHMRSCKMLKAIQDHSLELKSASKESLMTALVAKTSELDEAKARIAELEEIQSGMCLSANPSVALTQAHGRP